MLQQFVLGLLRRAQALPMAITAPTHMDCEENDHAKATQDDKTTSILSVSSAFL